MSQRNGISPELFLIYINNIDKCLHCTKSVLYSDDTDNFMKSKSVSRLYAIGHQAVASFKEWFSSNRLTVCKNKTLCIIFHRKQK